MRKFGIFFGHMHKELIEAYAPIINDFTGEHTDGDVFEACRFGYSLRWCDGSANWHFMEEETLEASIKCAEEFLAKKGWHLGEIQYTGADITDEIIEKYTEVIPSLAEAHNTRIAFLDLLTECMKQPWYEDLRKAPSDVGVYNIMKLPTNVRENSDVPLVSFESGKIVVNLGVKWSDYGDGDGWFRGEAWHPLDEARTAFHLSEDTPAVDVVGAVVEDILRQYDERDQKLREACSEYKERFSKMLGCINNVLRSRIDTGYTYDPADLAVAAAIENTLRMDKYDKVDKAVQAEAVYELIANYLFFDWSTAKARVVGNITEFVVKLVDNIFTKSRDISCKDDGGAASFRHLRKPGYSWQLAKEPLPYFHVVYGFAPENCMHPGSPTLISAYSGDGGFTYRGKDWFAQGDEVADE